MPENTPPQPKASVGASDDDDSADVKPKNGSLAGTIKIEGATGAMGVVALEPVKGGWKKRVAKQRVMEQRDRQFAPRLLAIPVGSTVSFPNFDRIFHNVFSVSRLKAFDLGIYRSGESRDVTFKSEGLIKLGCNLHANMSAHVVVVAAPHYAVSDAAGSFHFRSLVPESTNCARGAKIRATPSPRRWRSAGRKQRRRSDPTRRVFRTGDGQIRASAWKGASALVAPRRRRGLRLLFFQVAALPRFARERRKFCAGRGRTARRAGRRAGRPPGAAARR